MNVSEVRKVNLLVYGVSGKPKALQGWFCSEIMRDHVHKTLIEFNSCSSPTTNINIHSIPQLTIQLHRCPRSIHPRKNHTHPLPHPTTPSPGLLPIPTPIIHSTAAPRTTTNGNRLSLRIPHPSSRRNCRRVWSLLCARWGDWVGG